jgi:glyoxylase-like metal-dependent hydrolase (beta-lactamase superfamily II)
LFPNAAVFISRKEQDNYLQGIIYDPKLVLPAVVDVLRDAERTHLVDTRESLPNGLDFEVVGGHTPGSSVVRFEHGGTRYVLTGDECYVCANRDKQRPLGMATNKKANADFIKSIADPAIVVLPCHDPAIFERYKPVTKEIVRIF